MGRPKISVIIPTYNRAQFIDAALISALSQSLRPIEILVTDDGSFDGTGRKLRSYADRFGNLKIFEHNTNKGVSAARNTALENASGEFIYFLDSDNYILSIDVLAKLYAIALQDDADMLFSHPIYRHEEKGGYESYRNARNLQNLFSRRCARMTLDGMPILVWAQSSMSFLFRHEFLQQENLTWNAPLRRWEDRPFYISCLLNAARVSVLPEVTRVSRRHDNSIMSRRSRYYQHANRDEQDVEMCLLNIEIVHGNCAEAMVNRPNLEPAYKLAQLQSLSVLAHRVLTNLIKIEQADARLGSSQKRRLVDIVNRMTLCEADLKIIPNVFQLSWDSTKTAAVDWIYLQCLKDGDIAGALAVFESNLGLQGQPDTFAVPRETTQRPEPRSSRAASCFSIGNTKPRVIIHLGVQKTGSSYLQNIFICNYSYLLSHGMLFPKSLMDGSDYQQIVRGHRTSGHGKLAQGLLNPQSLPTILESLGKEITDTRPDTLLISSEMLVNPFRRLDPSLIRDWLDGVSTKLICYVRRPDDWLESFYKEAVNSGWWRETRSLGEILTTDGAEWLSFETRLRPWLDAFGSHNMEIATYEHAKSHAAGVLGDFLDRTGLSALGPGLELSDTPANRSFGRSWTETIRIFNRLNYASETYRDDVLALIPAMHFAGIPDDPACILPPESRARIVERWAPCAIAWREAGLITDLDCESLTAAPIDDGDWAPLSPLDATALGLVLLHSADPAASAASSSGADGPRARTGTPEAQNRSLRARVARLDAERRRRRERLDRLRRSLSWRLTAPLRMLARIGS